MKQLNILIVAAFLTIALIPVTDAVGNATPTAKTFDVKKGGNLIVDVENAGASVEVKVWSRMEVEVTAHGIRESEMEDLEIGIDGNTVKVYFDPYRSRDGRSRVRFDINVPSQFNLDIGTSGGDIDVNGDIEGTVAAGTAGGSVTVDDVKGTIDLRTAGGDVEAGDVDGDAEMKTAGGDVEVGDVKGNLSAKTAGGDIEAGNVEKDLDAKTAGGDITCDRVGGEADVETAGGDIDLGVIKGEVAAKTAGGDIDVKGGNGAVVAKTSGGDIRLAGIVGYVKAATAGGDIRVDLEPSNAARSDVETKGGDIEFVIPANAKVTIEARIRLRDWDRGDTDRYDILSDFEAASHERDDREVRARFVINGGGKEINLETVNGIIEIRKR
jgi:DUF4097 and DUF4098 domain-containing protein YvlB